MKHLLRRGLRGRLPLFNTEYRGITVRYLEPGLTLQPGLTLSLMASTHRDGMMHQLERREDVEWGRDDVMHSPSRLNSKII